MVPRAKDSIKVFLRLRPHRPQEGDFGQYDVEHTFDESKITFHLDRRKLDTEYVNSSREDFSFTFDRVFDQQSTQDDVFDTVAKDAVLSVLEGYNATVFAYGQTGSGKTFTITGGPSSYAERGIIPRAIKLIFDEIKARSDAAHWSVTVSYMQIYNNRAMDLLNRGKDARSIDDLPPVTIHESEDEIILKGLEGHASNSTSEALNLLFLGDTNRLYCETPMNATSSRSHCIFTVMLEARPHGSATVRRSKLNLVDLAGSERVSKTGVTGTLLNEAKYINVSLFHLEHVIVALSEHQPHIPFRDSVMTMTLRDSLGGNCRTAMIATGHPADTHLLETISTCRFAQRVASIRQKAVVNEETDPAFLIRQLRKENAQLRDQIAFLTEGKDTDPSRTLSADEQARCREAVQRFLSDPTPGAQLTGLGGDFARINYCFTRLKECCTNSDVLKPSNGGGGTPPVVGGTGFPLAAGGRGGSDEPQAAVLLDRIKRLETSLQQKENEISLLISISDTSTASTPPPPSRPAPAAAVLADGPTDVRRSSETATAATTTSRSVLSQIRSSATQRQESTSMTTANAENYDLDKLADPELIANRQTAFEAFRRSYRKYEQIESGQEEMKTRIQRAKKLAIDVNGLVERMKALKARVQQLRAERALVTGGGGDDGEGAGPEEQQLMTVLTTELRPAYQAAKDGLAQEKERIEHLNHIMRRAQEQLIKDFETWFDARSSQLAAAMRGGTKGDATATSSPPPPPTAVTRTASGANFTAQQHLLQLIEARRVDERLEKTVDQQSTSSSQSTPAASFGKLTGDPQADAVLQNMYRARDALRQQVLSQQQQQR